MEYNDISLISKTLRSQYLEFGISNVLSLIQTILSSITTVDRVNYSSTHLETQLSNEIANIDKLNNHHGENINIILVRPNNIDTFFIDNTSDHECFIIDNSKEGTGKAQYMRDYHAKYKSMLSVTLFNKNNYKYSIAIMSYKTDAYTRETAKILYTLTRDFAEELKNNNEELLEDAIEFPRHISSATQLFKISPDLSQAVELAEKIAPNNTSVLITGESGTGKEVLADFIYEKSKRNQATFIKVNCGAIPETLIESSFFGYEKGAFTGALRSHAGYFEQANGGTLFLDEIGDTSMHAQVILLRILENSEVCRLGSEKSKKLNFRLIVATNKDLKQLVLDGKFREDLYYRINCFPIHIPPLRWRKNDIPLLVNYFIQNIAKTMSNKTPPAVSKGQMASLYNYNFPGNVRELLHIVERALILALAPDNSFNQISFAIENSESIIEKHIDFPLFEQLPSLETLIENYINFILLKTEGKIVGKNSASALLDIHPNTLRSKLEKMGIATHGKRGRPKKTKPAN